MTFEAQLAEYGQQVKAWREASAKAAAAVKKLEGAVATGNARDLPRLREKAKAAVGEAQALGEAVGEWSFDTAAYLRDGRFLTDLRAAAAAVGLRLYEGDGVLHCPPVLVRTEPDMEAVRIEKKLEPSIRPDVLAKALKKLQDKGAKATDSGRFIETLFAGYRLVRGEDRLRRNPLAHDMYEQVSLRRVHKALTALPGSAKEYSLADFLRDFYHLTKSEVRETKDGHRAELAAASTAGKEKPLLYVADDGSELRFAFVRFAPPATGRREP